MHNEIKLDMEKHLLNICCEKEAFDSEELKYCNTLEFDFIDNTYVFNFSNMDTLENKIILISEEDFLYAIYCVISTHIKVKSVTNQEAEILLDPRYCFYSENENAYRFAFYSTEKSDVKASVKDFVWNLIFDATYTTAELTVVSELLNFLRTSRRVSSEDIKLFIEFCKYGEKIVAQYINSSCAKPDSFSVCQEENADSEDSAVDELLVVEEQVDDKDEVTPVEETVTDFQENVVASQAVEIISAGECKVDFSDFLSNDIGFSGAHTKNTIPKNMSRQEEYNKSKNKSVSDFSNFLFLSDESVEKSEQNKNEPVESKIDERNDSIDDVIDDEKIEESNEELDSEYVEEEYAEDEPYDSEDDEELDSEYVEEEYVEDEAYDSEDDEELDSEYVEEEYVEDEAYDSEDDEELDSEYVEEEYAEDEPYNSEDDEELDSKYVEEEYAEDEPYDSEDEELDSEYVEEEYAEDEPYDSEDEELDSEYVEEEYAEDEIGDTENHKPDGDVYEDIWSFSKKSQKSDSAELSLLSGETFNIVKPICNIGRKQNCSDIVLKDARVSRQHAIIRNDNSEYYLLDAGSSNGTFVNGTKLLKGEERLLSDGDVIKIGIFELYFSYIG